MTWPLPRPVFTAPPFQHWKPIAQLFAEPYVVPEEEDREEREHLTQAEWWELFFFIKKLNAEERQHVVELLQEFLEGEVGTPQRRPLQVWTGTFAKLGRGRGGQIASGAHSGGVWEVQRCKCWWAASYQRFRMVDVCVEIPHSPRGPLTICSFSCYGLTFFPQHVLDFEILPELTVPVELAQDLMLSLPQQLDDSALRDLFNCYVYRKYGPEVLVGKRNRPFVLDDQLNLFRIETDSEDEAGAEGECPADSSRDTCLWESVVTGGSPLTVCCPV